MAEKGDKPRDLVTMMVDREFARRVKRVAEFHGLTMSEALERFAGKIFEREDRKAGEAVYGNVVTGGEA